MSKVLIINGSPRAGGNTAIAVREMETVFRENGVEVTTVQIGGKAIRGCIACGKCAETGRCVFDDAVNELAPLFEQADGLVVASPVYYASANATLIACLDRLFHSTRFDKRMKVGASVVCARRGGCSATFDELNKYFTISGMPGRLQPVLEQHLRQRAGRGRAGRGGPADHARAGAEHDVFDAVHRAWEKDVRPARDGAAPLDALYLSVTKNSAPSCAKCRNVLR